MTSTMLALGVASLVDVSFDGGGICDHLEKRTRDLVTQVRLPDETRVSVRFSSDVREAEEAAILELEVSPPGEAASVERQQVNDCEEGFNFVRFYLDVWSGGGTSAGATPSEQALSPTAPSPQPAESTLLVQSLGLGAFAVASTNYPETFGYGTGFGLSVNFSDVSLGASLSLMSPAPLRAAGPNVADYRLDRTDWQLLGCFPGLGLDPWLMPCLGGGVTRLEVPATDLAPLADNQANLWMLDAGLSLSRLIGETTRASATLLARYGVNDLDLTNIGADRFTPKGFEVTLRLGLRYELSFNQPSGAKTGTSTAKSGVKSAW